MEKNIFKKPSWIVIVHSLIHFEVLERLSNLGDSALATELEELHDAMDEDYETFTSPQEEDAYLAHVNDEYIEVAETLPNLYWYAQFLIAYSFFERALDAVCVSLQQEQYLNLSLKDTGGQGISRAKVYLSKVCNIQSPFLTSEWQWALLFGEIRNVIAHRNGYLDVLPKDKNSLFNRLGQKNFELKSEIMNQEDAQIVITKEIILKAIKVYCDVVKDIGGLDRAFITPKHGLPSRQEKK